jgi:mannosyltransferase OCH1-like enzyme
MNRLDIHFKFFEELADIPKKIHISWKSPEKILDNNNPMILNGVKNAIDLNPDYETEISSDIDVDNYIKNSIPNQDYQLIKDRHIVEKVDLWRLLKMYLEGGIYMDLDRYCNITFNKIFKRTAKCILPTTNDKNFSQDLMISARSNPLFLNAIALNLFRRKAVNPATFII